MPICIHCATPIESLYMRYGKDHIVLSPCTSTACSSGSSSASPSQPTSAVAEVAVLADEYLEHDLPIVIIDLILAKPQAYRHLMFNRARIFATPQVGTMDKNENAGRRGRGGFEVELWSLLKQFLALSLVDAYIRWFYLCVQPPRASLEEAASALGKGKLSGRLASLLQQHLPMQAGIFFPSLFTPHASNTLNAAVEWSGEGERAIVAVCSATPLWLSGKLYSLGEGGGVGEDAVLPTLVSYINVLMITLIEGIALHLCVGVLTCLAVRELLSNQQRQRSNTTGKDKVPTEQPTPQIGAALSSSLRNRNRTHNPSPDLTQHPVAPPSVMIQNCAFTDPLLGCKALLLSQLSPLILLTFVLLWSTKFPHSPATNGTGLDRGWMVWIIRTFLASLNAGVAIGTILPSNSPLERRSSVWWPPFILGAAWTLQALTSFGLYTCLS